MNITYALIGKSVAVVGLATAVAVGGVQLAQAAPPVHASTVSAKLASSAAAGSDITLPAGGALAQRVTKLCERAPKRIERVGKAETRLKADADTKGSIARAKAREAKATTNKHEHVAKRFDRVVDRRTKRLAKLPTVQKNLTAAKAECAELDLPTPSASPS